MPLARFTPAILLNVNRFDEDETKLTSVQIVDPLDSANVAVSGPGLVGPVLKNWIEDKVALVPELEQTSYKSAQTVAKKHPKFCHFFILE